MAVEVDKVGRHHHFQFHYFLRRSSQPRWPSKKKRQISFGRRMKTLCVTIWLFNKMKKKNITQKLKRKRSSSALKWAKKMNEEEKLQFLVPILQCWKVILIERNEFHSKSWFYYTPSSTHWTLHILHPIRESRIRCFIDSFRPAKFGSEWDDVSCFSNAVMNVNL